MTLKIMFPSKVNKLEMYLVLFYSFTILLAFLFAEHNFGTQTT